MKGAKTVLRILCLMLALAGIALLYMHFSDDYTVSILSGIAPFIMAGSLFLMTFGPAFNPPEETGNTEE
jgi:hypothetical protein